MRVGLVALSKLALLLTLDLFDLVLDSVLLARLLLSTGTYCGFSLISFCFPFA
jgi:hypothetical protein